jgi:hypothetical protein
MVGSFEEEVKNLARRTLCRALGELPTGNTWPQRVVRRLPFGNFAIDTGDDFRRTAGRLARCSNEPDLPGYRPQGPPPAGQCAGVLYRINYATQQRVSRASTCGPYTSISSNNQLRRLGLPLDTENTFVGPIGSPERITAPQTYAGIAGSFFDSRERYKVATGDGDWYIPLSGPTGVDEAFHSSCGPARRIIEWEVTREDGLPDDCGGPGRPPGYNGPLTYRDPTGVERTEDVDIELDDPYINEDGKPIIPFVFIDPDLTIRPELELDFEPEISLGGGDNSCGNDYDPDFPPLPPGPEDPEPPDDNRRFTAIVTVATKTTSLQTATEFSGGTTPTIYLPRLGSVVFAVAIGEQAAWTKPTDLEVLRQFTPVPGGGAAFDYNVKPALVFSIQAFPVYLDSSDDSVIP